MQKIFYIDEAGRWPLAWPVYVGVVLEHEEFQKKTWKQSKKFFENQWYQDSKKLTEKKRNELYEKIIADQNFVVASGSASALEIDRLGIIRAQQKAICKAMFKLLSNPSSSIPQGSSSSFISQANPPTSPSSATSLVREDCLKQRYSLKSLRWKLAEFDELPMIHIDGNHKFGLEELLGIEVMTTIKGDSLIPQISMASIIAKVERDDLMKRRHKKYKVYGFDKHKWYGTQMHRDMIAKHGPCKEHRSTFIKNFI